MTDITPHGVVHFSFLDAVDSCPRRWPKCDECGCAAEIICASPMWEAEGFIGKGKRAAFCCRKHTAATSSWWWFWIIDEADQDDDCMGLWSRDSITHIAHKTWGPPFLAWLLGSFDLSTYAEADARKEDARRSKHADAAEETQRP